MKARYNLIIGLFVISIFLISGCTEKIDVTGVAKSLPIAKDYLAENPNADLKAELWTEGAVAEEIEQIRSDCGQNIEVKSYIRATFTEEDVDLVLWIDPNTKSLVCTISSEEPAEIEEPIEEEPDELEEYCLAGWKCSSSSYKGYQGSDCFWENSTYCPNGCENGECKSPPEPEDPIVCPTDIFTCPDGTGVSRMLPNCEFAECPELIEEDSNYICNYNAYNCADFSTQEEAQVAFEYCGGMSNDIHHLDGDDDGIACEAAPSNEPEEPDSDYICNYNAYNCADFDTHAQAQEAFEYCGGLSNDIHDLDRDNDGLACESLP